MEFTYVYLAAEDVPGLAIGRTLIGETRFLRVHREVDGRGFGALRRKAKKYATMAANGYPVVLFTDLDRDVCPSVKIRNWLGTMPGHRFVFRVCVREIESWLLADGEAIADFMGIHHRAGQSFRTNSQLPRPAGSSLPKRRTAGSEQV